MRHATVTVLLVPGGTLRVEDTWQEIHVDGTAGAAQLAGWHLTLRTAYLNGGLLVYGPATRDLLAAASWAISDGPAELMIPCDTAAT